METATKESQGSALMQRTLQGMVGLMMMLMMMMMMMTANLEILNFRRVQRGSLPK